MGQERLQRVAEEIKRIVGGIIHDELNDPRVGFVTITDVEITRDLHLAKISFSCLGSKKEVRDTQVGLSRSRGFIRRLLGQRMRLRYTPELSFRIDEGAKHSVEISRIIQEIKEKEAVKPTEEGPAL